MTPFVLTPVRSTLRAVATTVVPDAARLDEAGWLQFEAIIDDALRARPAALRRQLVLFVRALQALPLLRYGRTFTALSPDGRTRFLSAIEHSSLLAIRRGFWGLRTLVFLGYYGRSAAAAAIGYRADPRGWEARA